MGREPSPSTFAARLAELHIDAESGPSRSEGARNRDEFLGQHAEAILALAEAAENLDGYLFGPGASFPDSQGVKLTNQLHAILKALNV
jgi:hypothetical protein